MVQIKFTPKGVIIRETPEGPWVEFYNEAALDETVRIATTRTRDAMAKITIRDSVAMILDTDRNSRNLIARGLKNILKAHANCDDAACLRRDLIGYIAQLEG